MKVSRWLIAALVSASCGGSLDAQQPATQKPAPAPAKTAAPEHPAGPRVNADAAVLADFKARVDKYFALRKDAIKGAPQLKETNDADKIKAAQEEMSARIRAANASAKHGDGTNYGCGHGLDSMRRPATDAIMASHRRLRIEVRGSMGP